MEISLLEHRLQGESKVTISLSDFGTADSRLAEQLDHEVCVVTHHYHLTVLVYGQTVVRAERQEVLGVQRDTGVGHEHGIPNYVAVGIASQWSEAHDLALVAVRVVTDELTDHGVE